LKPTTAPDLAGALDARPANRPFVRIRRTLVIVYVLLLVVLAASALRVIHNSRESAVEDAIRQSKLLARILEEHLARTFGEADKVLQGATEHIVAQGGLEKLDEQTVHDQLRRRQARLPQAAAFGVVRADGRQFARASEYPVSHADMSEREDFIHLRRLATDLPYIGDTVKNPVGQGYLIHLSRRITLPDGRFGGIVRCGIATEYLARFYDDLQLPPETVLALVKPDGNPIFRLPAVGDPSRYSIANTAAFKDGRPAGHQGHFERTTPFDGREHLVAYHWLPDQSLGVFIGQPMERVYAASERYSVRIAAGGLLIALVFGAIFRLILRSLAREEDLSLQQRAAELALRDSEAKYRALVENIPQRVFYKDLESRYLAVNRQYADDLGMSPQDIVGRDDYAFHPRELADQYRQGDQRVVISGQAEAFDESYVRDGREYTIHTVKTPVRDEGGEIIGVCGIFWDITEQRELQDRLKESEASLRAIFENVQEGIMVADAAGGRLVMANPAICRMLGYSEAELLALAPHDLHPPEAHARLDAIFRNMSQGKYGLVQDLPMRRKDGSLFYVDSSPTAFALGGRPCFLAVFRDITEIRQAHEALQASEARLREAQRLARIGNWELDLTTNALYWSDEIFRIFDVDPARFHASYEAFLAAIHPDDRDKVNAAYRESVERHGPYEITHRLLLPDGRVKHVHERGETDYAGDGTPLRSFGTVQDVTDRVLAEQEVRALNETLERRVAERTEELARANRELESFSYSVSHDLRAPLRAINGFSRILQDSEEFTLSDENRDLLDRIVRNTNRMGDLIDDILDYSRASQTALNRKEVDLTQLARATCDEYAPSYPDTTVRIGQLGNAWGDPAMLRQVFDNLVANAFKYSGKRDGAEIEIGAEETPGATVIFVRDNGAGFDMQYAGKLFGMFQRMHTDKDFPGTGVGLAIVKRIVERHGGRIWAEAAVGAGATFRFALPRNEQGRTEV